MTNEPKEPGDETNDEEECLIPGPAPPEALEKYLLKREPFDGAEEITAYVEGQSPGETVTYLERIAEERVHGVDHETWDVHTSGERYWVITNPTNLYSQRLFPSADYTLSFHVGLMARVMSRRTTGVEEEQQDHLSAAWRRWTQAAEALDRSKEAEEFQAVGMRSREALLALTREIADESMVPKGTASPKSGDFIHWAELIVNALASGSRNAEVRAYLKAITRSTWQLVAWLTHASSAIRLDAEIAVDATRTVIAALGMALLRFRQGVPSRCPRCSSYRVSTIYVGELSETMPYAPVCQSCGWSNVRADGVQDHGSDTGAQGA